MTTTNIIELSKYDFSNSVALIVAAGPSLDLDIEAIKEISNKNNAYIFAVGSANKTLLKHGITPDAIFTYDPSHLNQYVIGDFVESDMDCPIVFGSTVGYETLVKDSQKFKYHMLINQDLLSKHLIGEDYNKLLIGDSPTIAIITLQALIKMGFGTIAFAGQNLNYYDNRMHADGIEYSFVKTKIR